MDWTAGQRSSSAFVQFFFAFFLCTETTEPSQSRLLYAATLNTLCHPTFKLIRAAARSKTKTLLERMAFVPNTCIGAIPLPPDGEQ